MTSVDELLEELRQKRDELRVRIHLGSRELKEEWDELEEKMDEFSGKARKLADDAGLRETGEGLNEALRKLGQELKLGYERLRKALR